MFKLSISISCVFLICVNVFLHVGMRVFMEEYGESNNVLEGDYCDHIYDCHAILAPMEE